MPVVTDFNSHAALEVHDKYNQTRWYVEVHERANRKASSTKVEGTRRAVPREGNPDRRPLISQRAILLAYHIGISFVAGTETSVHTLNYFVISILLHPETSKIVREELDRVVGLG